MRIAIAGCVVLMAGVALAQTSRPSTAPATTKASIEDQLKEQLSAPSKDDGVTPLPPATIKIGAAPAPVANLGAVEPVSGTEPKTKIVQEGTILVKRVVRLTKDEKSGNYLISFDSDGKVMADPPMIGVPCKSLEAMEDRQSKKSEPIRFQITGEVSEYKGRNYILIQTVQELHDMHGGMGGG